MKDRLLLLLTMLAILAACTQNNSAPKENSLVKDDHTTVSVSDPSKPGDASTGYSEVKEGKWTTTVAKGSSEPGFSGRKEKARGMAFAPESKMEMGERAPAPKLALEKKSMEMPSEVASSDEADSDDVSVDKRPVDRPSVVDPVPQPSQTPIKAGETDDNDRFDYYLEYHGANANLVPKSYFLDVTERYILEVKDKSGKSLPNCEVSIVSEKDEILWEGKTDSRGQMLFFPRAVPKAEGVQNFLISLRYQGKTVTKPYQRSRHGSDKPWKIEMPVEKDRQNVCLEVLFLLDTTGSMGDEIAQIQGTLLAITARIRQMEGNPKIRYGMVLYRDVTDDYVARRYDFTTDVSEFDRALSQVTANGGGDYEEAVNMGLYTAVDQMEWSKDALRLVFLVADAPPHLDYPDDVPYTKTLFSAVKKGIKIFPTAASGLDPKGSYIFRQIAQFTQAKFLFIEYGKDKNISGKSHGVQGSYDANNLDDLVLRIVQSELKNYIE